MGSGPASGPFLICRKMGTRLVARPLFTRGAREARPHLLANQECPHYFLAPGSLAGVYIDMGNAATLLPAKSLTLLTPCFLTSSIRRIECIGSMVTLTPANSDLMRS